MSERFYLPADLESPELTLAGSEAHHLAHVLRIGPGRQVVLFDGQGVEVDAVVESVSKREVRLRPGPIRRPPPPTAIPITLAVAPPKGDRFRWLVEKAAEIGVARLIPLLTERSVVDPRENKLEKLRQTVIAASKQSGRCELMELTDPVPFHRLWEIRGAMPTSARQGQGGHASMGRADNPDAGVARQLDPAFPPRMPPLLRDADMPPIVLLQPGQPPLAGMLAETDQERMLLIGPEGGFTDSEIDGARETGAQVASLGSTILRTETAAIAAAVIASHSGVPNQSNTVSSTLR